MPFRPMFLIDAGESKELIPLKILILVHNFCFSLIAYLPIFFEEVGFSKSETGILMAIPCLCMVIGPPIWGAVADILHRHKQVHEFCHVTSALLIFAIQFVRSFPLMCVVVFAAYCQFVPTLALLDLASMKLTERVGGDFGKQKLYGAFGYGVGGFVCGMMAWLLDIKWCFTMMLVVSCISLAILVRTVPKGYGDEIQPRQKGLLKESARHLMRRPDVLVLFGVALLAGINGGLIDSFLFLNFYDLSDDGGSIVSVFVTVETMSEIPIFFLSSSMIQRFGTAGCLAIVVVAFLVRNIVYAYMKEPWYVVPVETLHGITFGLLVTSLTMYLYKAAPKGVAGTTIGLLSAFQRGLGAGTAALAGGFIYKDYGAHTLWKIAAYGIVPITLVAVGVFAWLEVKNVDTAELEEELVDKLEKSTEPTH